MTFIKRFILAIVIFVLIIGLLGFGSGVILVRRHWPKVDGSIQVSGLQGEVTVIRDSWGIPHIYASNTQDLFFAQGYVQAQDRFWQMEFSRRVGSGRLSEILGKPALDNDRFIRTVGWHRAAAQDLENLDAETLSVLQSYSDGINAYINANTGRLGLEFTLLGLIGTSFEPEPWTPYNTLTWAKVMAWDLGGNMNNELLRARLITRVGEPTLEELWPGYPQEHPEIVDYPLSEAALQAVPEVAQRGFIFGEGEGVGSNSWVISGSRSETGTALLANDPHLGIQMPAIWYEMGLHCVPLTAVCPYDVVGASFPGAHGVIIGHNDRIAWGVTNLGPDVQDLYVERVNPQDPNQYEYQGEWEDMQIIQEVVQVAGQDDAEVVNVRITRHGPIINDVVGGTEQDWAFGWQPLALSWTALEGGEMTLLRSVLLINRAQNWDEFRFALSFWDVPSQNFVYADVDGNIGYQSPGRIPIRAQGDGSMPVPGWTGEYEWIDYIPFDELPYSFNPPEGYIVTANNAVISTEYPYFLSRDWAPGYRAQRIVDLIEEYSPISITDIQVMHADSLPLWAKDVLPYVTALISDDPRLAEALTLLQSWDGRAVRDSAAAALFEAFRLHLVRLTYQDELGEALASRAASVLSQAVVNELTQPDSPWFNNLNTAEVEGRDDILLQALHAAVGELSETLGNDMSKWRWGDLHTATFTNAALGQSGIGLIEAIFNRGPVGVDGSIATVNATSYRMTNPYTVSSLPSYRMIVDLGDLTNSLAMHTTGQSGHPFHRHYDNMIDPWRNFEYHPLLFDQAAVDADAQNTLILRP
ncbi:MAG: penicillin acylase family protein [Anaerolineales bacterium]